MSHLDGVRAYLDGWGSALDDQRLVEAVITAGVVQANPWLRKARMAREVRDFLEDALYAVDWRPPDDVLSMIDADMAAGAVADLPLIRLMINPGPGMQTDLYLWVHVLRLVPVVQVTVHCDGPNRDLEWQWPLRFGFLPDEESVALREAFTANRWWPHLQTVVDADEPSEFLVLPGVVSRVPAMTAEAALPVVLGAIDVPDDQVAGAADRIALDLDSWGCHLANQPADPVIWLNRLTESLAHNDPIETALSYADSIAEATATYTALVSFASTWGRLETVIERYANHLLRLGDHMVTVPQSLESALPGPMPTGQMPAGALGQFLQDALNSDAFSYAAEAHEATGFVRLIEAVGDLPEIPPDQMGNGMGAGGEPEEGVEVRIVNGRVLKDDDPHRLDLVVGERYGLEVWIGVESAESITVPGAPAFPTDDLPKGPNRIDVVLTCLGNAQETQRTHVTLPEKGDSDRTRFELRFDEAGTVFGRMALLHAGRVIQTAVLRADVVAGRPSRLGRPEIEVEAVNRARIGGVPEDQAFDLAVVVNRDTAGRKTMTAISDDGVSIRSAAGLEQGIEELAAHLDAVADDPEAFAEMTSETTMQWLYKTAHLGSALYGAFVEDHAFEPEHFSKGRLQVVSAVADAFLPVEFFYELRPPTKPVLCDGWEKAVLEGECGSCDGADAGERPVCLSGFWGVKYVIERHAHRAEYGNVGGDWVFLREPVPGRERLKPLDAIVWASSDNILAGDRKKLGTALSKRRFPATRATDWEDVQVKVGSVDPSMIFLLPHTGDKDGLPATELGGLLEEIGLIRDRMGGPRDKTFVAVLLGCETARPMTPYQGMVPEFRRAGAGVVVTTINAILGRHAVPVARELLGLLKSASKKGDASMGDTLRDLRRQALADGYPMVLSVVAFGDADWVLTT